MTTTDTITAGASPAQADRVPDLAEEAPAMTTTATTAPTAGSHRAEADPIVYRPLDAAWGDADALAQLRAIRAERTAGYERDLAMAEAVDARDRARRRAERQDRANRRGHGRRGGLWGLLPA